MMLSRREFLELSGAAILKPFFDKYRPRKKTVEEADEELQKSSKLDPSAPLGLDIMSYYTPGETGLGGALRAVLDETPTVFSMFSGNTMFPDSDGDGVREVVPISGLKSFTRAVRQYSEEKGKRVLIGTDYESRGVNRILNIESPPDFRAKGNALKLELQNVGFTSVYSDRETFARYTEIIEQAKNLVGNSSTLFSIYEAGKSAGKQLANIGIDLIYGPMVDLVPDGNINYPIFQNRTISGDPIILGLITEQWVRGIQESGVRCVLKHAPGFGGGAVQDPHQTSVSISLRNSDLFPYVYIARQKMLQAVMVTHASIEHDETGCGCDINPNLPASLNPYFIDTLRRITTQTNSPVLLFSDGLGMSSLTNYIGGDIRRKFLSLVVAGLDIGLTDPPTRDSENIAAAEGMRTLVWTIKRKEQEQALQTKTVNMKVQMDDMKISSPTFRVQVIEKIRSMTDIDFERWLGGTTMTQEEAELFALQLSAIQKRLQAKKVIHTIN